VLSISFLVLSFIVLDESGAVTVVLSVFTVVESVVVELEEPPQAANELIAKTTKSFFIVMCLFVNDLMVNTANDKK
jgi:hypothetical protein